MQRPRRTAEFYEELPSISKRQSRQRTTIAATPAPGTAKKYVSRQSRIAVPTRPSSLDRAMDRNPYLNIPPNSAQRGRKRSVSASGAPTPQKTPIGKSSGGAHVIFTAEKHRGGGIGGAALQNDKRWVQDQVIRITEYLRNEVAQGAISGITPDFFNARSGGLRQMSTKQFVTLVNYFLHLIFGSRFSVGTNHVEDIVNILQKLQYPHQLNKSWLKTPNAQHSFGNVMLLFDFFMDFVQPRDLDPAAEFEFPFAVVEENTLNQPVSECQRIPDVEFQAQLVRHTEEAFILWDKGLDPDAIQTQTCDALIQKRCNIQSLADLLETNKQLEQKLAELEQQRPQLRKQDEVQFNKLSEELKNTFRDIEITHDDINTESKQLKQLQSRLSLANEELCTLESEIASINSSISTQLCSVQQRDALMEEVMQHKHMLKCQERAVRDLRDCSYHQQVILSRIKNQLREQVEKFNTHIHEVAYLQLHSITPMDDMQLPLNATQKHLLRIAPTIKNLRKKTESRLKQNSAALQQLEQQILQLTHEIEASIKPKTTILRNKLAAAKLCLQQYEAVAAEERISLETLEFKLKQREHNLKTSFKETAAILTEKREQLLNFKKENENIMAAAEKSFNEYHRDREAYLDEYEATLQQSFLELEELSNIVESNQQLIDTQKKAKDLKK